MKPGDKIRFVGCSEDQVKWGNHSGNPKSLTIGAVYTIKSIEEHTWHTKIFLIEKNGSFNTVCFEEVSP
jgi:hypothetical protein